MIKAKALLPRSLRFLNPSAHAAIVKRTIDQGVNAAKEEVSAITANWSAPPAVRVQQSQYEATITVTDDRWTWLDQGTRPHVILPKSRKVLKFSAGGGTVFARRVNHPGTKARYYTKRVQQKVNAVNLAATFANGVRELTR